MNDDPERGRSPDDSDPLSALKVAIFGSSDAYELVSSLLNEAVALQPRNVMLALIWPGRSPDLFTAWAAMNMERLGTSSNRFLRFAFLGIGRRVAAALDAFSISTRILENLMRARLQAMRPGRGAPVVDDIYKAFTMPRTAAGHTSEIPLASLIPCAVAIRRGTKTIWRNPWERLAGPWLGQIKKKVRRDYYASAIQTVCDPARAPFFAFILPQASAGPRRVDELAAIPGKVDLIVLDLTDRETGAAYGVERLETLLRDLAVAQELRSSISAPLLVLAGQPADFVALQNNLRAKVQSRQPVPSGEWKIVYPSRDPVARRIACPLSVGPPLISRVTVSLVGTSIDEASARLWDLADRVAEANQQLSAALRDGSVTLRLLARRATSARILLEKSDAALASRLNWMERRGEILSVLGAGGAGGYESDVRAAISHATDVAEATFDQSPTGVAFSRIASEATSDQRVLFVVDNGEDAVYAQEQLEALLTDPSRVGATPEVRVVAAREWGDWLKQYRPNRLVLALRGPAVARILLTEDELPETVDVLCLPAERDRLAFALERTIAWREYQPWHTRAKAIITNLPPSLHKLEEALMRSEMRQSYTSRRLVSASRGFFGWYEVDSGESVPFYEGTPVTVLVDGIPTIKAARDLEPGALVFVMPDDLRAEISDEFEASSRRTGGSSAEQAVVRYKEAIKKAKTTSGSSLNTSSVLEQMRELDPSLPLPTEQTIRTWLSADEHMEEGRPYAPGGEASLAQRRFIAFAQVIGLPKGLARFLIEEIEDRRTELRAGGILQRNRFERLLFDPEDVVLHFGIPRRRVAALRRRALAEFREVVEVRLQANQTTTLKGTRLATGSESIEEARGSCRKQPPSSASTIT